MSADDGHVCCQGFVSVADPAKEFGKTVALPGESRDGSGADKTDESCARNTVDSFIPRSRDPVLHPVIEMSARVLRRMDNLRDTRHLKAE